MDRQPPVEGTHVEEGWHGCRGVDSPDLILTDATVLTQDDDRPEAGAVAFRDGRVLDVGPARRIEALAGARTETLELGGATVLPGFIDAHTHAARLGELHFRADLSGLPRRHAAVEILGQRAERTPAGGWVIGWNWDESEWEGGPLRPADLEAVSEDHPVMARRVCGHKAVVNQAGLAALDLPADTPGLVTDGGEPTGLLTEDAADVAWEACAPAYETCVKGLRQETRDLAALGITHVADTVGPRDVRLLTRGAQEGFFWQRSVMYVREALVDALETLQLGQLTGDRCSLAGVKIYTDGSVGARTAAISEPYRDDDTTGMLLRDAKAVAATAERAQSLGLQVKAHAIGDRAIQAVLDGLQAAGITAARRPRVEHAEMVTQGQLETMAERGVIACFQPNFIGNWQGDGGLYHEALGDARRTGMNPLRSAIEAGVRVAFGSDGMPYGPLYGIRCATEHPDPQERLSVTQAIRAYTRDAAYALGLEETRGVLRAGAVGDAVVLDEDPRRARDLSEVSVARTIIEGRVVWDA